MWLRSLTFRVVTRSSSAKMQFPNRICAGSLKWYGRMPLKFIENLDRVRRNKNVGEDAIWDVIGIGRSAPWWCCCVLDWSISNPLVHLCHRGLFLSTIFHRNNIFFRFLTPHSSSSSSFHFGCRLVPFWWKDTLRACGFEFHGWIPDASCGVLECLTGAWPTDRKTTERRWLASTVSKLESVLSIEKKEDDFAAEVAVMAAGK